MQANEFEKQVSQKMDELSFTPSSPVWTNIQEQLRKKKERKRLLFWLPLFLLLLTGGIWFIAYQPSNNSIAINDQNKNVSAQESIKLNTINAKQQTSPESDQPGLITSSSATKLSKKETDLTNNKPSQPNSIFFKRKPGESTASTNRNKTKAIKKKNSTLVNTNTGKHAVRIDNKTEEATLQPATSQNTETVIKNSAENILDKDSAETKEVKDTTIKKDTVQKKNIKQKKDAKWTAGLIVFSGVSGVNNGTSVQQASVNSFLPTANGPSLDLPVSNPQNKLGVSLGFVVRKNLSDRVAFVTGLQYNFASNTVDIGSRQTRDTVISANYSSPVRVTQYYNKGIEGKDYINNYHFISLPVGLDVKLFSHAPVYLHAGFGIHQLVATNALVYSNQNKVYYQDKNAFNQTQFSSTVGINYQASFKGRKIMVGPQIQYNWTQLQKDHGANRHLFSAGLNARIDLLKL